MNISNFVRYYNVIFAVELKYLCLMNTKTFSLIAAVIFLCITTGNSQIDLKKIAKETERSVNRRIERGIERGVDNTLDNAEDTVRGRNKKKKKNKNGEYDESNEVKVIKDVTPFTFSGNLTIQIDGEGTIDDNLIKLVSDRYDMAIRPMLVKKPNNLMIYDKKTDAVTKINTELYEDKALKEYLNLEPHDPKKTKTEFERTSDIKEVETYIARKYLVDGDDYEGEVWLSAEVDLNYDLFAAIMEYQKLDLGYMYGFPLEMHITFKNGDTLDFFVKSIEDGNPDKALLDVSEYDLIDMTDLKSGN